MSMIVVRSPVRISLCGGGTDFESFYKRYTGLVAGFTIDRHTYTTINRINPFCDKTQLTYSVKETLDNNLDTKNNGLYGVFKYLNFADKIQLSTISEMPNQAGIASSSAFIASSLVALLEYRGEKYNKGELGQIVNHIERVVLQEPGGAQDGLLVATGGFNQIQFNMDGSYKIVPLKVAPQFIERLEQESLLFYLGQERQSFKISSSYENPASDKYKLNILELAKKGIETIERGDLDGLGALLVESWENKRLISPIISNEVIDEKYQIAMKNGAYAYRLLGSGGGGSILCLSKPENHEKLIQAMGLKYTKFKISWDGVKRII